MKQGFIAVVSAILCLGGFSVKGNENDRNQQPDRIEQLKPESLWKYFALICSIPHGSTYEKSLSDKLRQEGEKLGCQSSQDKYGNLILKKAATPGLEKLPILILQAHMDMVLEKNKDTQIDLLKDPIQPRIKDGFVIASGSTLGADDGIGVAAAMSILADNDLKHGPLEVLLTVQEDGGIGQGAPALTKDFVDGRYMINLDSEDDRQINIHDAGGTGTTATKKFSPLKPKQGYLAYSVQVSGLQGGHTGADAAKNLGNANKVLARALFQLAGKYDFQLASFNGGNRGNAIPREAAAVVFINPADSGKISSDLETLASDIRKEKGRFDPECRIAFEQVRDQIPDTVMTGEDSKAVIEFIYVTPEGVFNMSPVYNDMWQTTTCLPIVKTEKNSVVCSFGNRTISATDAADINGIMKVLCKAFGFECVQGGIRTGWGNDPDSPFVKLLEDSYRKATGTEPVVFCAPGGTECGTLANKYQGMQAISIGPSIIQPHSPSERVQITSVQKFYKILVQMVSDFTGQYSGKAD